MNHAQGNIFFRKGRLAQNKSFLHLHRIFYDQARWWIYTKPLCSLQKSRRMQDTWSVINSATYAMLKMSTSISLNGNIITLVHLKVAISNGRLVNNGEVPTRQGKVSH